MPSGPTVTPLPTFTPPALPATIDGEPVDVSRRLVYRGVMLSGVPNMGSIFGYTNTSWTLRADLGSEYVCRLLNHMEATGTQICTPRLRASDASMQL